MKNMKSQIIIPTSDYQLPPPTIFIKNNVILEIEKTIISNLPECGGILGKNESGEISEYYYDMSAESNHIQYVPDVSRLNDVIQKWSEDNIQFCGFVHSHLFRYQYFSEADYDYAEKILKANESIDNVIMILIIHDCDNRTYSIRTEMITRFEEIAVNLVVI